MHAEAKRDLCRTCGKDREGSLFECPACGAMPDAAPLPRLEDSWEDRHEHAQLRAAIAADRNWHYIIGGSVFLIGCGVTIGSFATSHLTGYSVIAWGAIAVGAADLLYGYTRT